jgi:hypothetical protein
MCFSFKFIMKLYTNKIVDGWNVRYCKQYEKNEHTVSLVAYPCFE